MKPNDLKKAETMDSVRALPDYSSTSESKKSSQQQGTATSHRLSPIPQTLRLKRRVNRTKKPEALKPFSRKATLGLERDDWKPNQSVNSSTKTKKTSFESSRASATSSTVSESSEDSCKRNRLSTQGLQLVKSLRNKEIFKQWRDSVSQSDDRLPVLESLLNAGEEEKVCIRQRFRHWASSFRQCDPRYQILKFFNDVAQEGADDIWKVDSTDALPKFFSIFNRASVFTVWRPCSIEAMRKMMLGQGVGKGLDIKGKSARKGKHSGFVPFMQIYEEKHKRLVRTLPKDGMLRVFYATQETRNVVKEKLVPLGKEMERAVDRANEVLANESSDMTDREVAYQHLMWEMDDYNVHDIDDYAPKCYGLLVPERLFWEGYVVRQDCGREDGSVYDTGRPSVPAFQDMNFTALRAEPKDNAPRAVLWHDADAKSPMCPRNLLMAYEEQGRVLPVVSDFDCFLIGTRRVTYECDLPPDQLHLLKWCVDQIEAILDSPPSDDTWTAHWLEVRKQEALKGFYPECPRFGFGDFKSYSVMQRACGRLVDNGCVRHGAECFNYYFPQELDEEFLVISDSLPGNVSWKYMKVKELKDHLCDRIDEGFTMPLNPKWVLCDPGWKRVYDRLIASEKHNIQNSMDVWFPPKSGIREKIEAIHAKHPDGFQTTSEETQRRSSTTVMDLGELDIKHYVKLQRAKRKLLNAVSVINLRTEMQKNPNLKALTLNRSKTDPNDSEASEKPDAVRKVRAAMRANIFIMKLHRDLVLEQENAESIDTGEGLGCDCDEDQ